MVVAPMRVRVSPLRLAKLVAADGNAAATRERQRHRGTVAAAPDAPQPATRCRGDIERERARQEGRIGARIGPHVSENLFIETWQQR